MRNALYTMQYYDSPTNNRAHRYGLDDAQHVALSPTYNGLKYAANVLRWRRCRITYEPNSSGYCGGAEELAQVRCHDAAIDTVHRAHFTRL